MKIHELSLKYRFRIKMQLKLINEVSKFVFNVVMSDLHVQSEKRTVSGEG